MLKTNRLIIKEIEEKDEAEMLEILSNEEVKKTYMIPDYEDLNGYKKLFNTLKNLSINPDKFVRGIFLNDTLIGFINDVEIVEKSMELGYVISPKHKGNGYMTEALTSSINYLFEKGYDEIICGAFDFNIASQRVMQKSGMVKQEKTAPITYKNNVYNCVFYSKTR